MVLMDLHMPIMDGFTVRIFIEILFLGNSKIKRNGKKRRTHTY